MQHIILTFCSYSFICIYNLLNYFLLIKIKNKSGCHLEFSINDVIRGKIIYTWPKWLPKMKVLLTLILQCIHIKRNVFTLYQEEYFLYTMSLWVCYRNFKAFVQRYSWIDDIGGKLELIYKQKNVRIKVLASSSWLTLTDTSLTSSQLIFFSNGFDTERVRANSKNTTRSQSANVFTINELNSYKERKNNSYSTEKLL